jgi:DNA-binding transcriptional MerR regulator
MKNYYDKTWKIGELARVFNINVQLLRHYDKEGLLTPDIRNPENKWRTYRYDQIYTLGLIRFLRHLDCSLDEIRDFMHGRTAEKTERFLNGRIELARQKYEKLLKIQSVINDRFEIIRNDSPYAETDQIFVCSEEELCYIETGGMESVFVDELFSMYPAVVFYNGEERKFAVRIPPDDAGEYRSRVNNVPAGDYLVGFHRGSYENITQTFERMREYSSGILEEGSRVGEEIITINIVDQLVEEDRDKFISKVMMKIYH